MDAAGSRRPRSWPPPPRPARWECSSPPPPGRSGPAPWSWGTPAPATWPPTTIGIPPERAEAIISRVEDTWGTAEPIATAIPSRAGDERFRRWAARLSAPSPAPAPPRLPAGPVRGRRPPAAPAGPGADPGAPPRLRPAPHRARALPGRPHPQRPAGRAARRRRPPDLGGAGGHLGHIEEFLTGVPARSTRVLATVLFTDIVASTERAAELGDRRWRELLGVHDDLGRRLVEQVRPGREDDRATGSWPPSTARGGRSAARSPCATSSPTSTSRSGPGCTPARSSCARTTSAGSPSTSPPGSWPRPARARSSSPAPCATWSPAPTAPSPTAAPASSRGSRATGSCSRWPTATPRSRP